MAKNEENTNDVKQFHARLSGRVQGVGFRFFARREASHRGIRGWVRNLGNAKVEVVAQGAPSDLNEFLGLLKEGPRAAFVDDVSIKWQSPDNSLRGFDVKPTGW